MAPCMKVRREGAAALLTVTMMAGLATPAFTQGIRIPDFRKGEETAVRLKPGEACDNCGVIRSIREVPSQRPVPVPQQVHSRLAPRGMIRLVPRNEQLELS